GPCDLAGGKAVEGSIEFANGDWFDLGLYDEPGNGVKIDAGDGAAEPESLDDRGAAAHKRVEDGFAFCVRIVGVVFVELSHDVRTAWFEGGQEDGAEDARGTPGKPLVHLVDWFERVA